MTTPIQNCVADWHRVMNEKNLALLDTLIADDAVFISPVVHTPQVGKQMTMAYLAALLSHKPKHKEARTLSAW